MVCSYYQVQIISAEILTYTRLVQSKILSNPHISVSSAGRVCQEIKLNVLLWFLSHACYSPSWTVCLITEQLFTSCLTAVLCQSLFIMYRFSSGRNSNLLKWRLDGSILYVSFYFSSLASWTFVMCCFQRILKRARKGRLYESTIKSKEGGGAELSD